MKDIIAHFTDNSAKYLIITIVLLMFVAVYWLAAGDVLNGTAHF